MDGRWITTDKGTHVFIKKGQTVKEALNENFDTDDTPNKQEFDDFDWDNDIKINDNYFNNITEYYLNRQFTNKETKAKLKNDFKNQLYNREILEPKVENVLINNLQKLKVFKVLDESYRGKNNTGNWFNFAESKLSITYCKNYPNRTLSHLMHELGHNADYDKYNKKYKSSSFISPTHNTTLSKMIYKEISSLNDEMLENIYNESIERTKETVQNMSKASGEERIKYNNEWSNEVEFRGSLIDIVQASLGNDKCMKIFKKLGHDTNYFNGIYAEQNRGTEAFAEITESLTVDKNKKLYNFLKENAPKTIEIYWEIIKELE